MAHTIVVLLCVCSSALAVLSAAGDFLVHRGTRDSLVWAGRITPWDPRVPWLLAELDPSAAESHLTAAVHLAPRHAAARVRHALILELAGHASQAEHLLDEALALDRGYSVRWARVNYFFRQARWDDFFSEARRALGLYQGDRKPLYRLAWRARPDAEALIALLSPTAPGARKDLFAVLAEKAFPPGSEALAASDRALALEAVDHLVAGQELRRALAFWRAVEPEWRFPLGNGDFRTPPSGRGFDWRLGAGCMRAEATTGGLRLILNGDQPDSAVLLAQPLPIEPGCRYRLTWRARTDFSDAMSMPYWEAGGARSGPLTGSSWDFRAPTGPVDSAVWLTLRTGRDTGTIRPRGNLFLSGVRIEKLW